MIFSDAAEKKLNSGVHSSVKYRISLWPSHEICFVYNWNTQLIEELIWMLMSHLFRRVISEVMIFNIHTRSCNHSIRDYRAVAEEMYLFSNADFGLDTDAGSKTDLENVIDVNRKHATRNKRIHKLLELTFMLHFIN
jgi:hypothetical protein